MPALWLRRTFKDANQLLPIFSRVHFLPPSVKSKRGRLLRLLFVWQCLLPVCSRTKQVTAQNTGSLTRQKIGLLSPRAGLTTNFIHRCLVSSLYCGCLCMLWIKLSSLPLSVRSDGS